MDKNIPLLEKRTENIEKSHKLNITHMIDMASVIDVGSTSILSNLPQHKYPIHATISIMNIATLLNKYSTHGKYLDNTLKIFKDAKTGNTLYVQYAENTYETNIELLGINVQHCNSFGYYDNIDKLWLDKIVEQDKNAYLGLAHNIYFNMTYNYENDMFDTLKLLVSQC